MKKILILIIIITLFFLKASAAGNADSLAQQPQYQTCTDSLKRLLQLTDGNDTLKAPIYTDLAAQYMSFDTVKNHRKKFDWQTEAINYTLKAIHYYSRFNDTTGLRLSFDNLANVYHAQKRYTQAMWFILQSNTLSRAKNDNVNIITSLLELSAIKMDIKNYTLAMRDLNEALKISSKANLPHLESATMQNYALLYSRLKNYPKEEAALRRRDAIEDSIRRNEEAKLTAKVTKQDSAQQAKKKLYTLNNKKLYKASSPKKITSLSF